MARRTRLKYTDEIRSYIWGRYQLGDSLKSIGRSFDRPSSSIHNLLARTGGIRPRERKRSQQVLRALRSARKSLEVLYPACRSVQSLSSWIERRPL